jgi:prepilin-type N-terminal cleavage/methylation domain-containing protein
MLRKMKNQKGFTLIEILVVVIIVAILAAFAVPRYLRYVEKSRSTEAQTGIRAIRTAYDVYIQTNGNSEGYTIEMAQKDARLGQSTLNHWNFEVVGNPPKTFLATSTAEFASGEGKQVWYDVAATQFHGYGIDNWTNPDTGGTESE